MVAPVSWDYIITTEAALPLLRFVCNTNMTYNEAAGSKLPETVSSLNFLRLQYFFVVDYLLS